MQTYLTGLVIDMIEATVLSKLTDEASRPGDEWRMPGRSRRHLSLCRLSCSGCRSGGVGLSLSRSQVSLELMYGGPGGFEFGHSSVTFYDIGEHQYYVILSEACHVNLWLVSRVSFCWSSATRISRSFLVGVPRAG